MRADSTFLLLASLGGVCAQHAGLQPAIANGTTVFATQSLAPTVMFPDVTPATVTRAHSTATGAVWTNVASLVQATSLSYMLPNDPDQNIKAICWYPVSGSYGDLTRWLFYATIAFALVGRTHQWLVIGALGASLTYSAATAVHALVLLWSGRPSPNPDLWATLGIVSLSAALAVPLLNWSKTIKNMGKDHEENTVGRSVVVYWSCLIFFAFLNLWGGLIYRYVQVSGGARSADFYAIKAYSSNQFITCSPPSGSLDLTAGQQQGWDNLYITQDFADINNCVNPCNSIADRHGNPLNPILRATKDLQLLTAQQVNLFEVRSNLSTTQKKVYGLWYLATLFGLLSLVWIVAQGLTIVLFGRRNPSQIRNFVYVKLCKVFARKCRRRATSSSPCHEYTLSEAWTFDPKQHRTASAFAKIIAIIGYLWAWSASVVAVLIAIGATLCTEYILYELPQNDLIFEIDQWGAWAATALVILAAFAYRFQGITEDVLVRLLNRAMAWIFRCIYGHDHQPVRRESLRTDKEKNRSLLWENFKQSVRRKTKDAWQNFEIMTRNEWKENMDFLRDTWQTAVNHQGTAHQRRRRAIASEMQEIPEDWQQDHDSWLELEAFIQACREFDQKHREKHGKGYLWQPRVTEEAPLRREFNTHLLRDIFRGRPDTVRPTQPYTQITDQEASFQTPDPTSLTPDLEMTQISLTVDSPEPRASFTSDTTAVPEGNNTHFPTTSNSPPMSKLVRIDSESPTLPPLQQAPHTTLVTDIPPVRSAFSPNHHLNHRRSPALSPDSTAAPASLRNLLAPSPSGVQTPAVAFTPRERHDRQLSLDRESVDGEPLLAEAQVDPTSRPLLRREHSLASMPSLEIVIPSPEIVFEDENGRMTSAVTAGAGVNNPFRQQRRHRRTGADVEETLTMLSPVPHSPLD